MPQLNFGQPQAGIFQMAYVVEDIQASMRHWIDQLGVGPWFLLTTAELNGYVEVIEMDAPTEQAFTRFYATALTWDGAEPVRPFG
jgi:hypothetical protein